jgi:hypothetical protein
MMCDERSHPVRACVCKHIWDEAHSEVEGYRGHAAGLGAQSAASVPEFGQLPQHKPAHPRGSGQSHAAGRGGRRTAAAPQEWPGQPAPAELRDDGDVVKLPVHARGKILTGVGGATPVGTERSVLWFNIKNSATRPDDLAATDREVCVESPAAARTRRP